MIKSLPQQPDRESLCQLSKEQLVSIIMEQAVVISELQTITDELRQEIQRLRVSRDLDSQTSSKPPSSDLIKKQEFNKQQSESTEDSGKRRPGGQPGHPGKTRKGNGLVDRYEIMRPEVCLNCGSLEFSQQPVAIQVQQVAQLVERPIEVVEYQRLSCECKRCGQTHTAAWPQTIVPGQDLGVSLQALLVWLGNYGHLPYEKQQELLRELGDIDIGVGTLQATNTRATNFRHNTTGRLGEDRLAS